MSISGAILESVLLKLNSCNKPSQEAYKILITKKCTRPEKKPKEMDKILRTRRCGKFGLGVNLSTT